MPKGIKKINQKMISLPKLNFPAIKLRAQERNGVTMVYDSVRNIYLVLTPEEWVRRHLVEYLLSHCKVPLRSVIEEYPVELNNMAQRADVVVMDTQAKPLILAECKAPEIKITQQTILQATRYNAVIGARYIILTNGITHFCYEKTESGYVQSTSFPVFG